MWTHFSYLFLQTLENSVYILIFSQKEIEKPQIQIQLLISFREFLTWSDIRLWTLISHLTIELFVFLLLLS